jgi:hypothetical protein
MDINRNYILSPVEIINTQLGIPQEYKQQCIEEAYHLGDSQNQQTNVKAIMSTYAIFDETPVYNPLLNNIKNVIDNFLPTPHSKLIYSLTNAWSAIYKKGHHTIPHQHSPSHLSFVYYLKSSGNTPLIFDQCNFQINPIDDMLIIFPSHVWHSVPKHIDEEDRICLAGNLKLIQK